MPWETADGTVVDHMATERWTDATRTARRMGSGAHSKFQGIPVASRICPSRQRRVFRLHQIQPLLIHSQHPKKKQEHGSSSVLSDAAAKLSTPKLAPSSGRASERDKGKENYPAIIPIPSLSLPVALSPLTHLLANGIALYSRKFVRGDSFVRRARPDPTWRRRRRTSARGELWPGAEGRNPRGEVAAL